MSRIITSITLPSLGPTPSPEPVKSRAPRRASSKPLPLVALTPIRTRTTVYGFGRINDKGRIAAAEVMPALGWAVGSQLDCRIVAGSIILCPHPQGRLRVLDSQRFRLPVSVRRRCRLTPGSGLLLAADPSANELVIFPPAILDELVRLRDEAGGQR